MKKKITVLPVLIVSFALCACGNQQTGSGASETETEMEESSFDVEEYEAEKEKADKIKSHIVNGLPAGSDVLLRDDPDGKIKVYVKEEGVDIDITAAAPHCIPYLAEIVNPLIEEAIEESEVGIDRITYMEDTGEAVWVMEDLEKGRFVETTEGGVMKICDIEYLYEYYKDDQPFMESWLRDSGYEGEIWGSSDETKEAAAETTEDSSAEQPETSGENETVISALENGFSFENMGEPTVNYDSKTDTYIVVAPSEYEASTFDSMYSEGKWEEYKETFASLIENIIKVAKMSSEGSNFRVLITASKVTPMLIFQDGSVVYDIYNSETYEKISAILEGVAYINGSADYASVTYNADDNMYMMDFILDDLTAEFIEEVDSDSLEKLSESAIKTAIGLRQAVAFLDESMGFTLQMLDCESREPLFTVCNGELTYVYSK